MHRLLPVPRRVKGSASEDLLGSGQAECETHLLLELLYHHNRLSQLWNLFCHVGFPLSRVGLHEAVFPGFMARQLG